jgi:hypothetical protein
MRCVLLMSHCLDGACFIYYDFCAPLSANSSNKRGVHWQLLAF